MTLMYQAGAAGGKPRSMARKPIGRPEDQLSLGARVRWARMNAGLGQTRLAQLLGVRQSAISMIENDVTQSTSLLPEIAHHTGVDAIWLQRGGPEPRSAQTPPPPTLEEAEALAVFGRRVQRLRNRRGWPESWAARGIMDVAAWKAMEAGRILPGPVALDLLCSRLQTSLDWLVRGMVKDEIPTQAPDADLVRRIHDTSGLPLLSD